MVLTLIFSTPSISGTLNPSPGCAVPMTAPLRSRTPRSVWPTVYQLPSTTARTTRPTAMAAAIPRDIHILLVADGRKYVTSPNDQLWTVVNRPGRPYLRRGFTGIGSDWMTGQ